MFRACLLGSVWFQCASIEPHNEIRSIDQWNLKHLFSVIPLFLLSSHNFILIFNAKIEFRRLLQLQTYFRSKKSCRFCSFSHSFFLLVSFSFRAACIRTLTVAMESQFGICGLSFAKNLNAIFRSIFVSFYVYISYCLIWLHLSFISNMYNFFAAAVVIVPWFFLEASTVGSNRLRQPTTKVFDYWRQSFFSAS